MTDDPAPYWNDEQVEEFNSSFVIEVDRICGLLPASENIRVSVILAQSMMIIQAWLAVAPVEFYVLHRWRGVSLHAEIGEYMCFQNVWDDYTPRMCAISLAHRFINDLLTTVRIYRSRHKTKLNWAEVGF